MDRFATMCFRVCSFAEGRAALRGGGFVVRDVAVHEVPCGYNPKGA